MSQSVDAAAEQLERTIGGPDRFEIPEDFEMGGSWHSFLVGLRINYRTMEIDEFRPSATVD